jgi:AmiR/NasT family two-component response regulator
VIIFTAQDDATLQQQAKDAGAYACLAKGCSGEYLVGLIVEADKLNHPHHAGQRASPR